MNGDSGHCRPPAITEREPTHAAPTELGWASGAVITTNMALLTELLTEIDQPQSPKIRASFSEDGRTPAGLRSLARRRDGARRSLTRAASWDKLAGTLA